MKLATFFHLLNAELEAESSDKRDFRISSKLADKHGLNSQWLEKKFRGTGANCDFEVLECSMNELDGNLEIPEDEGLYYANEEQHYSEEPFHD